MADPAQLWKCESKQQAPVATRNPMWGFLKGLEGFDTERARECLVRLLDKHYDTIAVLKLATKRDLIEDAGILPGDALRIVTAAKEYVAPRDPSPEPPTSQRDHASTKPVQGVEHRQDAYRPPALRETTVLSTPPGASQSSNSLPVMQKVVNPASQQEAGKGVNQVAPNPEAVKGVNQVAPNPEAVKGVNQVAPKPEAVKDPKALVDPTLPPPWRALVDGNTGYIYYWNPVTNITQYSKPSPLVAPGPPFPSGPPPSSVTSGPQLVAAPPTIPVGITYPHTCRLCDAQCISEVQFRSHYSGQRHNAAVREAKQPAQIPKPVLNPAVKETKETAQPQVVWGLKQPSQTQQVASGAEQPSQSTSVARVHACGVCNVQCGNEFVLRSHFNGKKHARKMELATESKDNRPTEYLYCSICDVISSSKKNLVMHFNGKRHAENMKEYSDSGDSSYYTESEIEF